jgi:HEAT repeat protein
VIRFVKLLTAPLNDSSVEVRYYAKKAYSRLKQMVKGQDRHIILPQLLDHELPRSVTTGPTFVYGSRDFWLYELGSIDYKIRVKAVMEVCRQGVESGFAKILKLLESETHEHVLATIAKYLPSFRKPGIFERIVPYLNHRDWRVRANTIEGLETLGDPRAVPLVMPFLSDADNRVKANAVKYLVKSHPDEVRRALGDMLGSPHEWMRDSAVFLAGTVDLAVSEDLLLRALKDPSTEIVRKAISCLELHARSKRVVDALASVAKTGEPAVRAAAQSAAESVRRHGRA